MARHLTASTRTDALHERLRADILGGRLVPGERLKFPELCERYATSVGAAREALIRLVGEGLVTTQPHLGYRVTPLSHADLADLAQARGEIESLALRLSVVHGDVDWESRVVAAHHRLGRTEIRDAADPDRLTDAWTAAHADFHLSLLSGCPNRRVLGVARSMREEAELYRQWSFSRGASRDRDAAGEHGAIVEAALERDGERAGEALKDHIAHTARVLITVAEDRQNPAPD